MGESRPPENLGGGGGRPQPARASIWMRRRWPGQRSLRRSGRGRGRGGSRQWRRRTGRSPPDRWLATKSRWPRPGCCFSAEEENGEEEEEKGRRRGGYQMRGRTRGRPIRRLVGAFVLALGELGVESWRRLSGKRNRCAPTRFWLFYFL